jgi:hypothetical protein
MLFFEQCSKKIKNENLNTGPSPCDHTITFHKDKNSSTSLFQCGCSLMLSCIRHTGCLAFYLSLSYHSSPVIAPLFGTVNVKVVCRSLYRIYCWMVISSSRPQADFLNNYTSCAGISWRRHEFSTSQASCFRITDVFSELF